MIEIHSGDTGMPSGMFRLRELISSTSSLVTVCFCPASSPAAETEVKPDSVEGNDVVGICTQGKFGDARMPWSSRFDSAIDNCFVFVHFDPKRIYHCRFNAEGKRSGIGDVHIDYQSERGVEIDPVFSSSGP